VNEKEANHPAHPMDRTANWCSHGGWFTLANILPTCKHFVIPIGGTTFVHTGDFYPITEHKNALPGSSPKKFRTIFFLTQCWTIVCQSNADPFLIDH
jgi:hypothetical protein